MQHLLQPRVLNLACVAGLASTAACYPRLSLWLNRTGPVWYLEAAIFVCAIILWGFVFAWHTAYTHRPVFVFKVGFMPFLLATALGIVMATICRLWLDPSLRTKFPEEFPPDLEHWLASTLFILAVVQLFLVFAAFDWCVRLFRNRWVAMSLTALFGVGVLAVKVHSLPIPVAPSLLVALLAGRLVTGFLEVAFYLRGGVVLVWWCTVLFEARHLVDFI